MTETEKLEREWQRGYMTAMQRIQGALSRSGKETGEEGQIVTSIGNAKFMAQEGIRVSQIRINQLEGKYEL